MTSDSMSPADFAAVTGNRNDFGFGNGNFFDLIVLFFIMMLFGGGWNNGGMGGNMNNMYPWLNQQGQMNEGFQNQALGYQLGGIRDAVYGITPQLCNGFAGVANGFAQAEISANARQMADMNQMFGFQSVVQNGFCDARAGIADLKYTVATENCADRTQGMMNTRDIMENCNRNYQAVMDKLCQLELESEKKDNANLRSQLNMATLQASQVAQDQRIVDNIYNRLKDCPVDCRAVYGNVPVFTCNGNQGCNGNGFYN